MAAGRQQARKLLRVRGCGVGTDVGPAMLSLSMAGPARAVGVAVPDHVFELVGRGVPRSSGIGLARIRCSARRRHSRVLTWRPSIDSLQSGVTSAELARRA